MVYLYMAWAYNQLGESRERNNAYEIAKRHSKQTTEKERLYIDAAYARTIEKDPERRLEILEELAEKYPKEKMVHFKLAFTYYWTKKQFDRSLKEFNKAFALDPNYGIAMNNLAYIHADRKEYEKAIEWFERYANASPGDANPFDSMGEIYFRMGTFDESIAKFKEALEIKPEFVDPNWKIAYILSMKEDYEGAMQWIARFIDSAPAPGIKAEGYIWRGFYEYWLGRYALAFESFKEAEVLAESVGNLFLKNFARRLEGYIHLSKGEYNAARAIENEWLDYYREQRPTLTNYYQARSHFFHGLVDIEEDKVDEARPRIEEMKSILADLAPGRQSWITFRLDMLEVEVLLAENAPTEAVSTFENASFIEPPVMYSTNYLSYNCPLLTDALARSYQQSGDLEKAIGEYERLLKSDPLGRDRYLIHPTYHYKLARLYEEKGWSTNAAIQYKRFIDIWVDADSSIPVLMDGKKRLEKMSGSS